MMATLLVFNIQLDTDAHRQSVYDLVTYRISGVKRGTDSGSMTHVYVFAELPSIKAYMCLLKGLSILSSFQTFYYYRYQVTEIRLFYIRYQVFK